MTKKQKKNQKGDILNIIGCEIEGEPAANFVSRQLRLNAQLLSGKLKKGAKKYPIEKAKGKHTKYNKL